MFQLNNTFLTEVGLDQMPEDQKEGFLQHIQEELEGRVGARISDGLADDQISEFEHIIDGDLDTIEKVLSESGDYHNDRIYQLLIEKAGFVDDSEEAKKEYASAKWLAINRPDYQQIVAEEISKLKTEITDNAGSILN